MIRRQEYLTPHPPPAAEGGKATSLRHRVAEASGKTAADCAALCCCCPCSVMNLVALAVYRVPAGLCRRMRSKRQRVVLAKRRRRNGGQVMNGQCNVQARPVGFAEGEDSVVDLLTKVREEGEGGCDRGCEDEEEEELEKEMWKRFTGTGFWKSPSARET